MLNTPVVFIIFNRPQAAESVFKTIAAAKPKKLFIIADGPRQGQLQDAEKCSASRAIIERADWDCEIIKNYSEINLGIKKRISSGLDWVFSQAEEAIILEDDCLPAPSFFGFCENLLQYYRNNDTIMHIGCNNFQCGKRRTKYSYFFSKYTHVWGWATWRRAWQYNDSGMKTWPQFKEQGQMEIVCKDYYERKYWTDIFDKAFKGQIDVWACQWMYSCWSRRGLSTYPSVNLISNIGFGPDATFCKTPNNVQSDIETNDIWEIKHPKVIAVNKKADAFTFDYVFGGKQIKAAYSLRARIRRQLKKISEKLLRR
ncbi:MAG: glycosyltransferase family 2 protein [Candidatus Omnitrophota bacterium]